MKEKVTISNFLRYELGGNFIVFEENSYRLLIFAFDFGGF